MMTKLVAGVLAASLSTPVIANAVSSSDALDFTIYQPYVSPRALGMGNAFTAVADDYSALLYNPAGLARITESQTNLEIRGMIDGGVVGFKNDVTRASDPSTSVAELNNILQSNYGKHFSARIPTVGGYYVRPHWGIAFIPVDLSAEIGVHQLVGPAASLVATQDSTLAVGFGSDLGWFKQNRLSVGMTFKGMYRAYYNRSFSALDLATDANVLRVEDAREGFTVDADVGVLWTPPAASSGFFSYLKPTFGAAVRNVADYGFTSNFHLVDKKTSGAPPLLQRRFDLGSSWELPQWRLWRSRFAVDLRDLGYDTWTLKKGTHVGVEFLWKVRSWFQGGWRAGVNQGYWTAGVTAKFAIFQLDFATYGEEVGPASQAQENRRYMAKCSLDW